MASRGSSLGLIACFLLLQPKLCEARAAASVSSTSDFPSGLTEAPREKPPPLTRVLTTKVAYNMPTTRSPFTNLSLGNLVRVVCGKGRTVSRPGVGANDTLVALPVASGGYDCHGVCWGHGSLEGMKCPWCGVVFNRT